MRARQLRNNYGAKLTMIDHWFGRLLGGHRRCRAWPGTTGVVLCTDHGHYLGEHDLFGKPAAPVYSELGRIPLLVRWPGRRPGEIDALTTSVDLHATIADLFGAEVEHPTHGTSLLPLIEGTAASVRELALFGYWGRHVGVTDGRRRYLRGCGDENLPLSMWSNRWSTMPVHPLPELRLPRPDDRAELRTMPGTRVPVICQPFEARGPRSPSGRSGRRRRRRLLFDTRSTRARRRTGPVERRTSPNSLDGLAAALRAIERARRPAGPPGHRLTGRTASAADSAHRAAPTAASWSRTACSRSRRSLRASR